MAKQDRPRLDFDPRSEFLTNPHDKYARFILKIRTVAEGIVKRYLPQTVTEAIDFGTFEPSADSFLDEYLQEHLSDVCYTARMGDREIKVTFLIEHKSTAYQGSVLFQLNRYIGNIHLEYEKQGKPRPLVIPILLYHGETPIKYETPETLYPALPVAFLDYIPAFRYILINIQQMEQPEIENIEDILLQKFFLVLKNSRNEGFIAQYWNKTVIFAPEQRLEYHLYNQVTLIYLNTTSNTYRQKIKNMDTLLPQEEATTIKSYIFDLYSEGIEKGRIEVVAAYIRNNPKATDKEVASILEVAEALVKKVRAAAGR